MKLRRIIFVGIILTLFLSIFSQGALAATTQSSKATVSFSSGLEGTLSLDYVPSLDFGEQEFSLTDKNYEALVSKTEPLPYVQVTDTRSNSSGWKMKVKASPCISTITKCTLDGATIKFSMGELTQDPDIGLTPPATAAFDVATDAESPSVNVVWANIDEGRGTWKTSWLPVNETAITNHSVILYVPGGSMKNEGYSSTLTWILEDTP